MKTTIVKNDGFETVGIEATESGRVVYNWGIAPQKNLYCRDTKEYNTEILNLIALQAQFEELRNFVHDFFETCNKNNIKVGVVNFEKQSEREKQIVEKIKNIVINFH